MYVHVSTCTCTYTGELYSYQYCAECHSQGLSKFNETFQVFLLHIFRAGLHEHFHMCHYAYYRGYHFEPVPSLKYVLP